MTAIEFQDRFRTEEDCELALAGPGGGCIGMMVMDAAGREVIKEIVDQKVDPNQHFRTDGWGAHRVLRSLFGVRLLTFQIAKSVLEIIRHLSSRMPPGG